jgi:hypothetical protein
MGRVKARPVMGLPTTELYQSFRLSQTSGSANAEVFSAANQDDNSKYDDSISSPVQRQSSVTTEFEDPPSTQSEKTSFATEKSLALKELSPAPLLPINEPTSSKAELCCPQCGSQFPDVGIMVCYECFFQVTIKTSFTANLFNFFLIM